MTYNTFMTLVERTGRVKISEAISVLEDLYQQASNLDDAIDEYCRIHDLIDMMFYQKSFIGDSDDYHNIAVVCAKRDDYDAACRFLKQGLKNYPYNIDLLADYLKYGMKCGLIEECQEAFLRLNTRKSRWNWRAYKFAIDYLIELTSMDLTDRSQTIEELISDFQKYLPDEEDAYLVEAEYLQDINACNDEEDASRSTYVSILQFATSEKSPVKRTPKCDLKLADYYYENGTNIEKAIELLERCKKDSVEIQRSVNRNYVYLLLALCKMTQYYELKDKISIEDLELLVGSVYHHYHIAALGMSDSRVRDCKKLIESFIRETRVPYPYDDGVDNMIY